MHDRTIITIGRQFGSGGREIGKKLADQLGVPFYDKELLELAAEQSGISRDVIENYDEMPTNSLLYSLSMGNYGMGGGGPFTMPINHQIILAQFDAIQKLSADGACVIVGRCADYALSKYPHLVSVFVHGDEKAGGAGLSAVQPQRQGGRGADHQGGQKAGVLSQLLFHQEMGQCGQLSSERGQRGHRY